MNIYNKILLILKWLFIIISVGLYLQSQRYDYRLMIGNVLIHDKFLNKWKIVHYTDMERFNK